MAARTSMRAATEDGTRLDKLRALAMVLADELDSGEEGRNTAQLAKQYRETLAEIDAIESTEGDPDGLGSILG